MLTTGGAETEGEEVDRRKGDPILGIGDLDRCSDSISEAKAFIFIFLNPATSLFQLASGSRFSHLPT